MERLWLFKQSHVHAYSGMIFRVLRGILITAAGTCFLNMPCNHCSVAFSSQVYWLFIMCIWDSIDWAAEMKRNVPAQGPFMQGLREATNDELVFLHGVQAGVPDSSESG